MSVNQSCLIILDAKRFDFVDVIMRLSSAKFILSILLTFLAIKLDLSLFFGSYKSLNQMVIDLFY